jgi:hypothetical protein
MSDNMLSSESIPLAWKTPLLDIPEQYRDDVLRHALSVRSRCIELHSTATLEIENEIAAESTPLSVILYCAYIPYHLVTSVTRNSFKAALATEGPGAALALLNATGASNDVLMVVGDLPVESHVFSQLDKHLAAEPSRYFIAGPGTQIETVLRSYAQDRDIPQFFIRTLDLSGGRSWDASPGPVLDDSIEKLFREQKPTRVIGFDPVRLPSTQIALDHSRKLGLPVTSVEAHVLRSPSNIPNQ